jgi:hypothetical protein
LSVRSRFVSETTVFGFGAFGETSCAKTGERPHAAKLQTPTRLRRVKTRRVKGGGIS